tara:strand:- start:1457 stop:2590 length:1134 start_codon:yes stop_codon:yes gene_type:complete
MVDIRRFFKETAQVLSEAAPKKPKEKKKPDNNFDGSWTSYKNKKKLEELDDTEKRGWNFDHSERETSECDLREGYWTDKAAREVDDFEAELSKEKTPKADGKKVELPPDYDREESLSYEKEHKKTAPSFNQKNKETIKHNVFFLKNVGVFYDDNLKKIFDYVRQIPPLHLAKLEKRLGSGVFGTAFFMDDGHVLKINKEVRDSGKYQNLADRGYGGKGDVSAHMVFDHGVVYGESSWDYRIIQKFTWVEMPKYIPLSVYLFEEGISKEKIREEGGVVPAEGEFEFIQEVFVRTLENTEYDYEDEEVSGKEEEIVLKAKDRTREKVKNRVDILQGKYLESALNCFVQAQLSFGDLADAHIFNVGVLIQNPDVWIVFDN